MSEQFVVTHSDPDYLSQREGAFAAEQEVAARAGLETIVAAEARRPGVLQRVRNTASAAIGGLGIAAASLLPFARSADAEQVIALIAHNQGAQGSTWRSDVILSNPYAQAIQVTLQGTPHLQSASPSDPTHSYVLQPGETLRIPDAHAALFGSEDGKARLAITTTDLAGGPMGDPITNTNIYNDAGDGRQFQSYGGPVTFHPAGTTLADTTVSGPDERYNMDVTTGPEGAIIAYTYKDSMGGDQRGLSVNYLPNSSRQHTQVASLFGLSALGADSSLTATILDGSASIRGTPINNATSDARSQVWQAYGIPTPPEPWVVGIDYNHDGIADNVDANGDGVLDTVINLSCSAPFDYHHWLIIDGTTGPVNYFGDNMPQWMGVDSGTGEIIANPPCSDSGQSFHPGFYVTNMTTSMTATYRVED